MPLLVLSPTKNYAYVICGHGGLFPSDRQLRLKAGKTMQEGAAAGHWRAREAKALPAQVFAALQHKSQCSKEAFGLT
jgi:hypothetical protein